MGNVLWAILWSIGLLVVGWPVGGILSAFYILILPFAVCIEPCKGLAEFLEKGVKLPAYFGEKIKEGKECCWWIINTEAKLKPLVNDKYMLFPPLLAKYIKLYTSIHEVCQFSTHIHFTELIPKLLPTNSYMIYICSIECFVSRTLKRKLLYLLIVERRLSFYKVVSCYFQMHSRLEAKLCRVKTTSGLPHVQSVSDEIALCDRYSA